MMLSGKEELAGGYRLANIRRAKRFLYLIEVVILIAAIIIVLIAEGRFSLVPFYFPINSIIYFVLLMMLIITIESFVFTALEMRLIKSTSTKYYICKIGINRALLIIIVCAAVILLLWLPFVHTATEDATATHGTLVNNHSSIPSSYYVFFDRDPLGLSSLSHISITAAGGEEARVYLVSEQNFNENMANMASVAAYRINVNSYLANPEVEFDVGALTFGKYYLLLDTAHSAASSVDYTLKSSASSAFLSYVPLFAIAFIVACAAWILYLWPLKRKYSEAAIYR
jgi:hypothetical protein